MAVGPPPPSSFRFQPPLILSLPLLFPFQKCKRQRLLFFISSFARLLYKEGIGFLQKPATVKTFNVKCLWAAITRTYSFGEPLILTNFILGCNGLVIHNCLQRTDTRHLCCHALCIRKEYMYFEKLGIILAPYL